MSEKLYIKDIKENKSDPRRKRRQSFIKQLSDSIRVDGLLQPLIINQDKTLVDGHYRLSALKLLGVKWLCWDKEKRIATLPRDKDFDKEFDSMSANTLREPQTDIEKAIFIKSQLKHRILKNLQQHVDARSFLDNFLQAAYRGRQKKYSEWEPEMFHILTAANAGGISNAIQLLDMLGLPENIRNAVSDEDITSRQARALAKIESKKIRNKILDELKKNKEIYASSDIEEISKIKDEKIQKKLFHAIKNENINRSEIRVWSERIEETPESKKLFESLIDTKASDKERESALKIVERSIEKKHLPSEEEMSEIVDFVHESQDTIGEWTDVRVDQAVEAMTEGKRLEEVEIISDADQRILNKYKSVVENIYHFNADHIRHFHSSKARNEAVNYLWTVENFVRKTLRDLNEINVMDADYVQVKKEEE